MQQRYHHGDDGPMPRVVKRMQAAFASDTGYEVKIQPGAGKYEDRFRFYWLSIAWMIAAFNGCAMLIILSHMFWGSGNMGLWIPYAIGTAIMIPAFAATACIYRFILFPSPGYYSSGADLPEDLAPYYAPPSYPQPTGAVGAQGKANGGGVAA